MDYIISITARDRSGIVAGVSRAVFEMDGNMIAASQTVHQGYFAMIIMCRFRESVNQDDLGRMIHEATSPDLHVYIAPYIAGPVENQGPTTNFIVTALGPDKPGILSGLTQYLGSRHININDLYCFVDETNEFVVICQVSLPRTLDIFMVQTDLETLGQDLGVTIHMRQENIFVATNELKLARAD